MHFGWNQVSFWPSLDIVDAWHDTELSWVSFHPKKLQKIQITGQKASTFFTLVEMSVAECATVVDGRTTLCGCHRGLQDPFPLLATGYIRLDFLFLFFSSILGLSVFLYIRVEMGPFRRHVIATCPSCQHFWLGYWSDSIHQ